ncbi:carboxyl-terminal protease [Aliidiomarina taiwanensis]|uniref:Carboxyl-terminal protease n=1 Tax=Aliidiomarina taiwanensis TaxID=946228 RepID=A0A432X976_9GAMM|nr:S41 family peptidase [Aliidiomarina taiwanensis]RUO43909.1 carboxyl-terminal protease [Aliidiomarina taiwanensis]
MRKKLLTLCVMPFLVSACGGSDSNDQGIGGSCSVVSKNATLFSIMQRDYLWNEDLPANINPRAYANMDELLNAIKSSKDRFSFIMTEQEYTDRYVNAEFFGYGFSTENRFEEGVMKVRYVFSDSPAAEVGLRRADDIIEINGVSTEVWLERIRQGTATNADIFGPNEPGVTTTLMWRSPDESVSSATIEKRTVETNTVFHTQREQVGNREVGYFVFDSFIDRSQEDINTALDQLIGVDELVIDLRYNGGGLIRIANQLASQTAWHRVEHRTFLTYNYNQNYQPESILFDLGGGITRMNLDRVYVLTSQGSCSASELVINSLTPFIEVITIGEQTCGKPVGQSPTKICDEILFAINFQTVNANGFGDYFDGLPVTCSAEDTVVADWGSPQDPLLATAYHYVNEGACPAAEVGVQSMAQKQQRAPLTRDPLIDKRLSEH